MIKQTHLWQMALCLGHQACTHWHVCYVAAGALVGPPWAKRENGFVFTEQVPDGIRLYYEPHCDYEESSLAGIDSADIVITPCVNQELLSYPLVSKFTYVL